MPTPTIDDLITALPPEAHTAIGAMRQSIDLLYGGGTGNDDLIREDIVAAVRAFLVAISDTHCTRHEHHDPLCHWCFRAATDLARAKGTLA